MTLTPALHDSSLRARLSGSQALAARAPLGERLPATRGRISLGRALSGMTWFGVGGPAEVLFKPADLEDLRAFLAALPASDPLMVIGVGSNLLVRDGGIPGVVIRLGRAFAEVRVEGEHIIAGAAALDATVARVAADAGLAGFEFLAGIPGTLGGAVRMNAGAHGRCLADLLVSVRAVNRSGHSSTLSPDRLSLSYRHCGLPEDWIFTEVTLKGTPDDHSAIAARMAAYQSVRADSQPERARTGGSTFANPPEGPRAWELIDRAGCRGLELGGARVSDKHCNFLLNTGTASATDLESLGELVRERVRATSGVDLRWEIRRVGIKAPDSLPSGDTRDNTTGDAS
ncbi:UDP-N-acetylmuramate dehydrogenase [Pararhodospirillum oryzae]|uniref:UDP-N-acetylenolpyruvoylglucosamine reductase n=1 Tax=Pararhodospirillum oryzae TaxID=478448 RepID=A0A512H8P8_9PROT|nr:UDP-N-acetylmuramate dehydrogenase [Pararhodospirillum oryzae]GEO81826.1 UDP-N-acetylenolpyruvoylglucosamine reductase [Pararhodospirillum oryzae]